MSYYYDVREMDRLWVAPIGVIPQHEHHPCTIVDNTYYRLNAETVLLFRRFQSNALWQNFATPVAKHCAR
jgi:hypothetical protein